MTYVGKKNGDAKDDSKALADYDMQDYGCLNWNIEFHEKDIGAINLGAKKNKFGRDHDEIYLERLNLSLTPR